jgi:serine-type D-Ala-D-Ala carboxypeptidase
LLFTSKAIDALLQQEIVAADVAPGATACMALRHGSGFLFVEGAAGRRSARAPEQVSPNAIFDLASLTKPLFATLCACLCDQNLMSLTDRLEEHLPWLHGTFAGNATLENLLAHRAGLQAHVEFFAPLRQGQPVDVRSLLLAAAEACSENALPAAASAGYEAVYSDLGYLLLGAALEETFGRPLDDLLAQELKPLALDELASARQWQARNANFDDRVMPTETVAYRGGEVHGLVHDDNAWAISGSGLSGHAGLFGTARAVARFGAWLLQQHEASAAGSPTLAQLLRQRPDSSLRAGFDGKSAGPSSAGSLLGPRTFGHLGFTGTSLWCDPERGIAIALLSNRVCPRRDNLKIRQARPRIHDALVELAPTCLDTAAERR